MQGLVYATLCDGPHPQVVGVLEKHYSVQKHDLGNEWQDLKTVLKQTEAKMVLGEEGLEKVDEGMNPNPVSWERDA